MESKIRAQSDVYNRMEKARVNFKKSPKDRLTSNYIETRIDILNGQWETFNKVHEQIINEVSDADYAELEYFTEDFYTKTEDLYADLKTELKASLDKCTRVPTKTQDALRSHEEQISVHLPKITIPSFSGRYSEWTTFRDLFLSLIHNNNALQKVQKLHYLKSYLTGEAEQLVRHLPITSDNYSMCWDLLENRFNNKKYVTNCILKRFFGQKNIVSENSSALKDMFDTTNECLNALKNNGVKTENWDIIVIYLLSSKLDGESRKQWEAKICDLTNDLPTLKQFLEFLEHRFRSLEFLNPKITKCTQSHHVVAKNNDKVSIPCSYCSDNDHKLGNCKKFANETLSARRDFVQTSNLCFNCLGPNHSVITCRLPTRCRICKKKHHSLLHSNTINVQSNNVNNQSNSNNVVAATATASDENDQTNITTCFSNNKSQVLLATALVKAETINGSFMTLRSLLDQGSQASFITESAVQLLGLKKETSKSVISGVGNDCKTSVNSKHVVHIKLQSIHDPTFNIKVKAHVLTKLTAFLPERQVDIQLWSNMPKLRLADPNFNVPNKIDLLLGAEVYCQILSEGLIKGPIGTPIAQNTRLGWILSGQVSESRKTESICNSITTLHTQVVEEEFDLKRFWEIESDQCLLTTPHRTPEEQRCEEFYKKTTTRDPSGRYIVKLPFKEENPSCRSGNSREIAVKRFLMQEKRLVRSPQLKDLYSDVIAEYLELGHMEKVPNNEIIKSDSVYLPHHAVVKMNRATTKLRVVFDASCRDNNGVSLNSELMIGPTLQSDLRHLVMRWRLHPVCLVANIVKMYRQILVASEDADYQRLVWRDTPEQLIEHLRMLRVTFGTAASPFLAVRTLHQIVYDEGKPFPIASERVLNFFYMDDLLTGCDTVLEGKQIYKEINELLSKGGFELQKWSSNNETLLKEISKEAETAGSNLELKIDEIIKILGLTWNRRTDDFEYSVQLPPIVEPVTKRRVISDIAKMFDPMGWIAPAIIKAKIFIQQLWLSGIGWDEELPPKLLNDWITYRGDLTALTQFRLPRWIGMNKKCMKLELHGFSDASTDAYAAVVYARIVDESGTVRVTLITCKTKVAPIKQVSIPRLELCGATLLARLLREVAEVLKVPKTDLHAWTDSTIVLAWLSSHPSRWKTFIANRVAEILNILDRDQWSHVSSADNPADCASRGVNPSECEAIPLWKAGPAWLSDTNIEYNRSEVNDTDLEEKGKKACHVTREDEFELWTKFSSLQKIIRIIAYCLRFISKTKKSTEARTFPSWLTSKELSKAIQISIKASQATCFAQEIKDIKLRGAVNKKSKLTTLTPFLDGEGILRVGGRLERADLSDDRKHPIVLPSKSHFTNLIIADAHQKTLHGGPQLMVNYLRSKYWILDVKNRTKLFLRKCVTCVRHAAQCRDQLMGQLPTARVTPIRPFYQSGVDYAGPIQIRTSKGRGHRAYKGYICLFVCMATRAVHLEAVTDLTSQGFLAAFKRFVSRRGHCADLYSDNGTNFVGAARELRTLVAQERSTISREIAESLATVGTTWHFIPPRAPHFGGLWESGIRSTKHHLKRVIGTETLTYEEMSTLLYQIEAYLNSRPLSQVSSNSHDPTPLTPGHFIIGEPLVLVPDANYETSSISSLKRWQLTQKMLQNFWRRWSSEYLTQFLQRHKWTNQTPEPKIGDVVLVKEDDLPPAKWLMGVITEKHKGLDNITRVVSLKCKDVIIKRPIVKLCVLPVAE
ncbi:hypothetical protein ABMA28_016477 [Loxostege sticticalis]|uniref:Integrase catalytic domain-containing protein n=1 Tax=Loxostege sticticalis TaxID=481309 RepID=A0ABD0T917_LOXSC